MESGGCATGLVEEDGAAGGMCFAGQPVCAPLGGLVFGRLAIGMSQCGYDGRIARRLNSVTMRVTSKTKPTMGCAFTQLRWGSGSGMRQKHQHMQVMQVSNRPCVAAILFWVGGVDWRTVGGSLPFFTELLPAEILASACSTKKFELHYRYCDRAPTPRRRNGSPEEDAQVCAGEARDW